MTSFVITNTWAGADEHGPLRRPEYLGGDAAEPHAPHRAEPTASYRKERLFALVAFFSGAKQPCGGVSDVYSDPRPEAEVLLQPPGPLLEHDLLAPQLVVYHAGVEGTLFEVHLWQLGVGPDQEPTGPEEPSDPRRQGGSASGRLRAVVPDHHALRGPCVVAAAHHEHGEASEVDDALRAAAQDQAFHGPASAAAHEHEVRAGDLRTGLTEQRLLRLEQLPRLQQEPGPDERFEARGGHGLPEVRDVQLRARLGREVDGRPGREGGVFRAV